MLLEERISKLRKEVSTLKASVASEMGQLEAYKKQQAAVVRRCKDKGFEPTLLGSLISQAELELEGLTKQAEQKLAEIEAERDKIIGIPTSKQD